MAYDHWQQDILVAADASLATAADIGTWAPGYQPVVVKAAALVFTTTVDATGAVTLQRRPTAGSAAGEVAIDVLNYTIALGTQGLVVYSDNLNQLVVPGEEVVFEVTDATPTVGAAHCILFLQPCWEHPDNNSDMTLTT